jgi:uncharacterized lipoprotein YmbA
MRSLSCWLGIIAIAGGCGASATSRFYTIDATATADGSPPLRRAIAVGPVSIPPSVDRPQIVVQVTPNQVTVDEFNRWAAPLDDSVARAVAGNLAVLLGTQDVAVAPVTGFVPTHRVTIDVQRFDSTPGAGVVVEALWAIRPAAGGDMRSGRTVAREPVQDETFEAIAAAHSRALERVSTDIAAAMRAQAESPPSRRRRR